MEENHGDDKERDIRLKGFDILSMALSAQKVDDPNIDAFSNLEREFIAFCDKEPVRNSALALSDLEKVIKQMRRIQLCPNLYSKRIGGISGGFSSGKSAFINSLTSGDVKMAVGTVPVTAVLSYVMLGDTPSIQGVNYRGDRFDITNDSYKCISHDFLKVLKFNLNEVISYFLISTPFLEDKKELFTNICLVDTPGYNPGGNNTTARDKAIASGQVRDSDFLIWTIGLDTNGTIPQSDIDFLEDQELNKPLYVLVNKADLRHDNDKEAILDEIAQKLEDACIEYEGISAYSARRKTLFTYRKKDIFTFLGEQNTISNKRIELARMVYDVFDNYKAGIEEDYKEREGYRRMIKSIILDAVESGYTDINSDNSKMEDELRKLEKHFKQTMSFTDRITRLSELGSKFLDCIDSFCDNEGFSKEGKEEVQTLKDKLKTIPKLAIAPSRRPRPTTGAGGVSRSGNSWQPSKTGKSSMGGLFGGLFDDIIPDTNTPHTITGKGDLSELFSPPKKRTSKDDNGLSDALNSLHSIFGF